MTNPRIFTIVLSMLLGACSLDSSEPVFSNDIGISGEDETPDTDSGDSTTTGDTSTGSEDSGDTSTDPGDGDGDGDTPTANPGPGEPCDPLLAFEGVAPCEDAENPWKTYTCATVPKEGDNEMVWEFECVLLKDTQGNGTDLGDGCDDDEGKWYNDSTSDGCLNSWCLGNGLGNDPDTDEHVNWPAGECSFGSADTSFKKGCCTLYCNADNPCEAGWSCVPLSQQAINIDTDLGSCVWEG